MGAKKKKNKKVNKNAKKKIINKNTNKIKIKEKNKKLNKKENAGNKTKSIKVIFTKIKRLFGNHIIYGWHYLLF